MHIKGAANRDPVQNLSPSDQTLFWQYGIGPTVPTPFECVHHAFEFHAKNQPDAVAVVDFEQSITYGELDRQANCVATRLRSEGITADSRVCWLTERSIPMVVGIIGILKAGAAYVPLDGNIVSDSTLKHALNGSGAPIALVLDKFSHRISTVKTLPFEQIICDGSTPGHCSKPLDFSTKDHGAYVIFTSGTTGVPKGVDVSHKNATNLLSLAPGNLGMKPGRKVSQLMNISFDMAAWEILGSMINGATLCLRGKSSVQWKACMKMVDIVVATPSMLAPHQPSDYPNIKTVAVAGEPCPKALADNWAKTAQFYNSCGPTEITIVNTMHDHVSGEFLSIGKPTPNNTVYVLDEDMVPLPIGETGLMWAGGDGISRGYIGLPEKTAERYMLDPFMNDGSMMFNTGDLGRWLPSGTLEPLGRIDNQVKIKGFRVELDGVATAMETCPGVKAAIALLIDGELWGFTRPANVPSEDVKTSALKVQPYYAVPTSYISMDEFPVTANGKTDRRELERMARDQIAKKNEITHVVLPTLTSPPPVYQGTAVLELPKITPGTSSSSTTSLGDGDDGEEESTKEVIKREYPWSGYETDPMPEKREGHWVRNIHHQIFSLYRRLFGIVFIVNMAIFIWFAVKGANAADIGKAVIGNLFTAILMRQDHVINMFFIVFTAVPRSWPIAIRKVAARVYTIGGLHSGAGVSGSIWLVLFVAKATQEFIRGGLISVPTLAVSYCILALLLGIIAHAHPTLRAKRHDSFEQTHRFLGWSATAFVWAQTILLTRDYKPIGQPLHEALVKSAPFWLTVVLTGSIILPWTKLRKVPVRAETLSKHAVRLHFDYVTPGAGSFTRISDDPLHEWHSFATIAIPGQKGYSLVVSRAGDWTSKTIAEPPTEIWVRGVPTYGVINIVPLFRRVILVATGSGIGPCTPAILQKRIPIKLLWTSPNVRETFGNPFVDMIVDAAPDAVIYDTRAHGKPDMVKLTYRLYKEFNAEAVVIISNQTLTRKVVYGMMSRGIPAFGAIWDS